MTRKLIVVCGALALLVMVTAAACPSPSGNCSAGEVATCGKPAF